MLQCIYLLFSVFGVFVFVICVVIYRFCVFGGFLVLGVLNGYGLVFLAFFGFGFVMYRALVFWWRGVFLGDFVLFDWIRYFGGVWFRILGFCCFKIGCFWVCVSLVFGLCVFGVFVVFDGFVLVACFVV